MEEPGYETSEFATPALVCRIAGHQVTTTCFAILLVHEESILCSVPVI
jgi:hypothetical protein